ncbi:serine/threonine-protein kinase [Polyangium sorediatum]|uniref:Protein kinase n=1 Tax=Polyangium sorediatum TaxID=889274 RepID=A0ABT6NTP3_9BACT|nr:serine/threonine-protein kinase [Polyangium sorediatum]MDI1431688.1 protein kinase [Polyangium sorediatum]
MREGTVFAERYEILHLAGTGGMAEVHRAMDRQNATPVALKLVSDASPVDDARFDREIEALGSLDHPGIVRYLGHGTLANGTRYLVMEWLEGEELARTLARGRLSVEDTIALARKVAEALASAHEKLIVHRDLKPENIFLVGARPDQPKLLDFGIAKLGRHTRITGTDSIVGTPGFMAPEQVRGEAEVDARADVFALGCVLFECLAGAPAFPGDHLHAILAKVLFAEPPSLVELRPEIPYELEALVMRMLAKDPADRPRDGRAVVEELQMLESGAATVRAVAPPSLRPPSLTTTERRPVAALLIGRSKHSLPPPALGRSFESRERRASELDRSLQAEAEARGVPCEILRDGSLALWTAGAGAKDLAARAARIAMELRALGGGRPFALAVGWGSLAGPSPLGDAIDRAAHALSEHRGASDVECPIALDELTAGLLDARFEVQKDGAGFSLHGERAALLGTRTLLGNPTPCVGRDRELRTLAGLFEDCIEEPAAQAALVTAAAGLGKSRLAQEFVQTALRDAPLANAWISGGDARRAGSAFRLVSQALCMALGIAAGDGPNVRRDKLVTRVSARFAASEARRVARFLGEIVDAPFPDEDDLPLRAARADVQLMVDQIRAAFLDFLGAECDAAPVLLVLEDVQWGDLPSVRLVDAALRTLSDKPFFVLATARPDVRERFPRLWEGRRLQEISLTELGKRASEKLVRGALGEAASQEVVDRIVQRAQGNAFYLEELIRAAAEGRDAELPETVVAMVQSRLASLDDEDRRLLRAASVFGDVFWAGGARALLGEGVSKNVVRERLVALEERELLSFRGESRLPGEEEVAFRHALVREGAYTMLTEEDRELGHRLAATWLESHGETDPLVLATHFERGQKPSRAVRHLLRAAEQAHRAGDDEDAVRRAERALALGPDPETEIGLLGIVSEARMWQNHLEEAATHGARLTRRAPPGSAPWVRGALAQFTYALRMKHVEESIGILDAIASIEPAPEVLGTVSLALAMATVLLLTEGRIDIVEPIQRRLDALVGPAADRDPMARAFWHLSYPRWEAWIKENPWESLSRSRAALQAFNEAGSRRGGVLARVFVGMNEWMLGANTRAAETLCPEPRHDEDFAIVASLRALFRVLALSDGGRLDEARDEATRLFAAAKMNGNEADEARGRWALGEVARRAGQHQEAARHAQAAMELGGVLPLDHAAAGAVLASALRAMGRVDEALVEARASHTRYEAVRGFGYRGGFLLVTLAQCLDAAGARGEARAVLRVARERLYRIAERTPNPEYRRSFLEDVPENARTLELAQAWLGPGE